jgi:hypothetical protein
MTKNRRWQILFIALLLAGCATGSNTGKRPNQYAAGSDDLLYQKLDPIYQARMKMIKARSPKADAATAWKQGAKAVLPSKRGVPYYPGLPPESYGMQLIPGNQEQIDKSDFLTHLQTLLDDDPAQDQAQSLSPTYRAFLRTRGEYEQLFNREMVQKMRAAGAASAH